jgi:mono/diheme cytochrome c family protein
MRKLLKVAAGLLALLLLAIGGLLGYLFKVLPPRYDVPQVHLPAEPARLEHGQYLARHVALCVECHSLRDDSLYAGPIKESTLGGGGETFEGDFGVLHAPNITPAALSGWSDEDLYRAVATGVTPDGRVLFPLMPYPHFSHIAHEDLEDILGYIRSLKPVQNTPPPSKLVFPLNLIVKTMAVPPAPSDAPLASDTASYGAYLAGMASCTDCHTPMDKGVPVPGLKLAGGREFPVSGGLARSANITPDRETGIGAWTRDGFIARFKNPRARHNLDTPVKPGQANTVMPWRSYAGMSEQDLGAIYDYLATVPAVKNRVQHFTASGI